LLPKPQNPVLFVLIMSSKVSVSRLGLELRVLPKIFLHLCFGNLFVLQISVKILREVRLSLAVIDPDSFVLWLLLWCLSLEGILRLWTRPLKG